MKVKTSLGFKVDVDEGGQFYLPDRPFTTAELKKLAREIGRACRNAAFADLPETKEDDYE